jgi:hypothetical protein
MARPPPNSNAPRLGGAGSLFGHPVRSRAATGSRQTPNIRCFSKWNPLHSIMDGARGSNHAGSPSCTRQSPRPGRFGIGIFPTNQTVDHQRLSRSHLGMATRLLRSFVAAYRVGQRQVGLYAGQPGASWPGTILERLAVYIPLRARGCIGFSSMRCWRAGYRRQRPAALQAGKPKTGNGNRGAISSERKAEAHAPDSVALEFLWRWVDRVVDAERTDGEIVPNTASDP